MKYCYTESPIGNLLLAGSAESLSMIGFPEGKGRLEPAPDWSEDRSEFIAVRQQLREYFEGHRRTFDLPLSPDGTAFQLRVWEALSDIPYGETRSYAEVAATIDRPKAVRAVGAANGRNPLPIVIPCHRVIGANGSLTGFGGGLPTKSFLLRLESCEAGLF